MMLGISSGDRMLDPARINRQPGGSKRSSHFCNRLDSDGPAQSPVLIPGRPLGGACRPPDGRLMRLALQAGST